MLETLGSEKWPKVGASDRAFLASRQLRCGGFSLLQAPPSWNPYVAQSRIFTILVAAV